MQSSVEKPYGEQHSGEYHKKCVQAEEDNRGAQEALKSIQNREGRSPEFFELFRRQSFDGTRFVALVLCYDYLQQQLLMLGLRLGP